MKETFKSIFAALTYYLYYDNNNAFAELSINTLIFT